MSTPTTAGWSIPPAPVGGAMPMAPMPMSRPLEPFPGGIDQFVRLGGPSRWPMRSPMLPPLPPYASPASIAGMPLAQSMPIGSGLTPAGTILPTPEMLAPGLFSIHPPVSSAPPPVMRPPFPGPAAYPPIPPGGMAGMGGMDPAAGPFSIPRGLLTRRQDTLPGAEGGSGTAGAGAAGGAGNPSDVQVFLKETAPAIEQQFKSSNDIEHVDASAKLMSLVDKEPTLVNNAQVRAEIARLAEIGLKTADATVRQNIMYVLRKLPKGAGFGPSLKAQIGVWAKGQNPDDLSIGDAQALMREFGPLSSPNALHLMNKPSWLPGQHFSGAAPSSGQQTPFTQFSLMPGFNLLPSVTPTNPAELNHLSGQLPA